jgi:hypothetical protein
MRGKRETTYDEQGKIAENQNEQAADTLRSVTSINDPVLGWFLDESSCAGRENLDTAHVERYDTKEDASAASEVALLQSLGLERDSLVVEFGAGTGQFTVEGCRLRLRSRGGRGPYRGLVRDRRQHY